VVEARRQNLRKNFLTVLLRADKDRVSAGMVPKDENDRIKEFTTMARVNTPKQYKCGSCGTLGHNARTCPEAGDGPSATQMMKQLRDEKRAKKAALKAAKAPPAVVEVAPVEEVEVMPASEVLEVAPTDVPTEDEVMEELDAEPTDEELMALESEEEEEEAESLAAFASHDPDLAALLSDMGI